MRTLSLRLSDAEYEQLHALALAEDQTVDHVILEAIHEYIQRKASHGEFRASLERAMQENAQLIAEMAEF